MGLKKGAARGPLSCGEESGGSQETAENLYYKINLYL